ncbi:hypothetical protein HELRODRAFT_193355, partial [Helobdella robusta]|uniref:WSC domain-containing protein n=1 Tax=Helobdella robusta TaxID=6412 RepID=T1FUW7_HELRO
MFLPKFDVYVLNIELFLFLLVTSTQSHELYVGCYKFVAADKHGTPGKVDSVKSCRELCRPSSERAGMIALKNGSECSCATRVSAAVSSSHCDMVCPADGRACGAPDASSVYHGRAADTCCYSIVGSSPQGASDTRTYSNSLLRDCQRHCYERNFTMFLITDNACKCEVSEISPKIVSEPTACGKCDKSVEFGGRQPIFLVRFSLEYPSGLSSTKHCASAADGLKDRCRAVCLSGWKGHDCMERDCSNNNGNCGEEFVCEVNIVNGKSVSECLCGNGKVRNNHHKCE